MIEQNYANHKRYVPMFHFVLFALLFLSFIGSIVNLVVSINGGSGIYSASLIIVLVLCLFILSWYAREFALKVQNRAIRAEENFRHFILTGKPLNVGLTMRQIIALRFASDEEFAELAQKTLSENIGEEDIKKKVKKWRTDNHRA